MRLAGLLAEAPFPLFGIPPRSWSGPAFVGSVDRRARLAVVQLVYLDALDGSTMGAVVSNAEPAVARADPIGTHLVGFVSRFEPGFLLRRVKRRRFVPFRSQEFGARDLALPVAGQTVGATLLTHRELPLQLARVALRRGDSLVDLGFGVWRLDVRELIGQLQQVDVGFATEFDARAEPRYPPPGWTEPDRG